MLVLAICHQQTALPVAVAIMEPSASSHVEQDARIHTVIGFLVLAPVLVAGQGISVTSVLITVQHVIVQDAQVAILATTDKPASFLAVQIARMDATNPMANVMAAKTINMERGAITFALLFVLCASKIVHALCVMLDNGVTCAPQTVVLDVRMEDVARLMAVAYAKMDGREASVMNV